jgi:hypothetical protein
MPRQDASRDYGRGHELRRGVAACAEALERQAELDHASGAAAILRQREPTHACGCEILPLLSGCGQIVEASSFVLAANRMSELADRELLLGEPIGVRPVGVGWLY